MATSGTVSATQVYQQVISQGGSTTQAQVAAALVSGIESGGQLNDQNPTSTASGLFQFLDTTWDNYGGVGHAGNATFEQQVAKFISESGGPGGDNFYAWAPDLGGSYNGSGTYSNIGGKVGQIIQQDSASWGAAAPATNMTAADWQALSAAGAAGGTSYLEAAAAGTNSAANATGGGSTSSASSGPDQLESIPGVGNVQATSQQASALDTIRGDLTAYGFTTDQVNQLTNWAWGEITSNTDPTQIAIDLQSQPAFLQQFPGFAAANQELNAAGLPAVSVQNYQQYQTTATQMAAAAGLPSGFINSQNIGTLIGGNVGATELGNRLNDALTLSYQTTPEQLAQFNQYFGSKYGDSGSGGLTAGQIAAIALDPQSAEPLIAQQIKTAQIGGASVTSGVGALDVNTATELATAGITPSQATSTFQNIAPLSALETARPGQAATTQGVVSPNQLALGNLLGNPAAQRQEQTAVEVAKAPFSGGGGFVQNARGATGTGSASDVGAGNT